MVMNYWGDDIRLESVAKRHNPYYDLAGYQKDDNAISQRVKRLASYVNTAIVADHELYQYASLFFERIAVVRQAIDTTHYEVGFPDPGTKVPLIVHSPSDRNIKGTRYILQALERLKNYYQFDFRLLEKLSHDEVVHVTRGADIVIDQLLSGTYGIFALEAMALGKPVLCYIREDLIDKYPSELPIVNSNVTTIADTLEKLLTDGTLRLELGKRGRQYVERYHDSKVVAKTLLDVYKSL